MGFAGSEVGRSGLAGIFAVLLAANPAYSQAPVHVIQIAAASAANFEPGLPTRGSIAAIFCSGLLGVRGLVTAQQIPLPTTLAGVSVMIGGAPAPVFAVADLGDYQQINSQVPNEAAPRPDGSYDILLQGPDQSAQTSVTGRPPGGDFFRNADGSGIFQHAADYSLVTTQHPVRAGETVIAYLTSVSGPLVPTNTPAPASPLVYVPEYDDAAGADAFFLQVAGTRASSTYLGLAPGLIGVYQLNFVMPQLNVANGSTLVVVLEHYTCSGNFFGTCGPNNGHPASSFSSPVMIPVQ